MGIISMQVIGQASLLHTFTSVFAMPREGGINELEMPETGHYFRRERVELITSELLAPH